MSATFGFLPAARAISSRLCTSAAGEFRGPTKIYELGLYLRIDHLGHKSTEALATSRTWRQLSTATDKPAVTTSLVTATA